MDNEVSNKTYGYLRGLVTDFIRRFINASEMPNSKYDHSNYNALGLDKEKQIKILSFYFFMILIPILHGDLYPIKTKIRYIFVHHCFCFRNFDFMTLKYLG